MQTVKRAPGTYNRPVTQDGSRKQNPGKLKCSPGMMSDIQHDTTENKHNGALNKRMRQSREVDTGR